jgi:2-aminoethanethiol dioxygenase/cysteine oxidase family protein/ATP-grasp domain-containing protein
MQVLVVCPDAYDRTVLGSVPGHQLHFFESAPSHWDPTPDFNPLSYLERALAYARAHDIDAVVSTHDLGDLLAATIARELNLPGPTPESVFLALHKYYGRLRTHDPVRCQAIPLFGELPEISYPAFFKAPWLKLGLLGFKVENPAGLQHALANARREYPAWARQYYPVFERAINVEQYPLATADIMLLEEFIEGPQVTVEGWVRNGEINIWAITDTNTYPGSRVIDNFSLPSRLPADLQAAIKEHATSAIRQLGFDNGFFNIEVWITEQGIITTEINARAAVCFDGIYELALGRSIFPAIVDLACGELPRLVAQPTGQVAGQFNLITFAEGRAADLLDYDEAANVEGLSILRDKDEHVRETGEFGVVLAQLEIAGRTYQEIHDRAERVRHRLLKQHSTSPWHYPVSSMSQLTELAACAADRLSNGKWDQEALVQICGSLRGLRMDEHSFKALTQKPSDEHWHEHELLDRPGVHASLFCLPEGAVIPLHDHPAMTVISKVLYGRLSMRTLLWTDPEAGLARDEGQQELDMEDQALVLADRHGVLHELVALSDCIFLDLFAPYYAEEEGRDCSYYQAGSGVSGVVKLCRVEHGSTVVS